MVKAEKYFDLSQGTLAVSLMFKRAYLFDGNFLS